MNPIGDQPPPIRGTGRPIWELIVEELRATDLQRTDPSTQALIADAIERDQIGRQRYGTPLLANNGRHPLIDAYQEGLDMLAYARQACEEGLDAHWLCDDIQRIALALAHQIRTSGACDFCGAPLRRKGEWYNGHPARVFMVGMGELRRPVFVCPDPILRPDKPTPPSCAWRICARITNGAHNMRAGQGCLDCGRPEVVGK